MTAYRDPFSGHLIITTGVDRDQEAAAADPSSSGDGVPEPIYSPEEEAVNRCIAGVRRRRI